MPPISNAACSAHRPTFTPATSEKNVSPNTFYGRTITVLDISCESLGSIDDSNNFSVFSMEVSMGHALKVAGLCIGLLLFGVVCGFQLRGQGQTGAAAKAGAPP